jgi:hypothetical protein
MRECSEDGFDGFMDLLTAPNSLEELLLQWESDVSLLEVSQMGRRMEVLDRLDAYFPDINLQGTDFELRESAVHRRAAAICRRLEAVNQRFYKLIRHEIQRGICPALFAELLEQLGSNVLRGNSYDSLDDLISGVLQLEKPREERADTGPEMVFYQPTPARHIFALIAAVGISEDDVVVDLGSGLGHVPLLVSACTNARCVGVEMEPAYVACASRCAEKLNLQRVSFREEDARRVDFSIGTVFYFYTPFTGSILKAVVNSLRKQAAVRTIKICTFGPCASVFAREPWLEALTSPEEGRVTIFTSRV